MKLSSQMLSNSTLMLYPHHITLNTLGDEAGDREPDLHERDKIIKKVVFHASFILDAADPDHLTLRGCMMAALLEASPPQPPPLP